jgi:hypothetical protein
VLALNVCLEEQGVFAYRHTHLRKLGLASQLGAETGQNCFIGQGFRAIGKASFQTKAFQSHSNEQTGIDAGCLFRGFRAQLTFSLASVSLEKNG